MKHAELIAKMTLEEKASFVTGKDFWQTKDFPHHGIPSAFCADGPHGIRKQAAAADHLGLNASIPATCFPTAATMANSWNDELGEEMGVALGEEAASQKVNVLLGPGTNTKRDPHCGRNFEYFSEDPYLAGKMAASYIRGIQQHGSSACVKHFACNNVEKRRMVNDSVVDERALREIYLTQFEIAIKEGIPGAIMSSYNKLNGEFTNENFHLLKEILRDEWGFKGVIITDWAGCNSRVDGIKCGNELEMPSCLYGIDDIIKAVKDGSLDEADLDVCVDRLLTLVETTHEKVSVHPTTFDVDAHHDIAVRCAEESIVLLKNNGVLPLDGGKISIIGDFAFDPRYQGAGSSVVNPTKLDKVISKADKKGLEGVACNYGLDLVGATRGFNRYGKKSNGRAKSAVKLANSGDVVLYFAGLDEVTEAEGLDRSDLKIPQNQIDLYNQLKATGKKIVVVLSCGSAVETDWCKDADAVVYQCLSGQAGAKALFNILTGKTNPSGKLAETFPVKEGDAASERYPSRTMTTEYRESLFVGYRYYDSANAPVSYPFGYGLSYTTFEYSDLAISQDGVTLKVTNTGKRDGKEVVQLYVGKKQSEIFRPSKELKGFKKVFVKAGESVLVTIPFDDKTFRYFNVKTNKWEIEEGDYQIYVSAAINDVRLEGEIHKAGTTDVAPYDKALLPSYFNKDVVAISDEEFKALLGKDLPNPEHEFINKRKTRIIAHENCTVEDLRYAKGWTGRAFSGVIRFVIGCCRVFGMRTTANTLVMGVLHQPLRGVAKFGGMSRRMLEGLITMFNGKFFKGLGMLITKGKGDK